MLKKSFLLLLLAACASDRRPKEPPADDNFIALRSERRNCDNGSDLTIEYASGGELRLALSTDDRARAIFRPVGGQYSASPGFYGKNSSWEPQQQRLNFLDPYGNAVSSRCGPVAGN